MRNVARCWAYETSVAIGVDIENEIPQNEYSLYYHPANKIHVEVSNQENMNKPEEIENHVKAIVENLKKVQPTTVRHDYYHDGQHKGRHYSEWWKRMATNMFNRMVTAWAWRVYEDF